MKQRDDLHVPVQTETLYMALQILMKGGELVNV